MHNKLGKYNNLSSWLFTQLDPIVKEHADTNHRIKQILREQNFVPDDLEIMNLKNSKFMQVGVLKFLFVVSQFTLPILMNNGMVLILILATILTMILETQYNLRIKQLEIGYKRHLLNKVHSSIGSKKYNLINILNNDVNQVLNYIVSFHECWSMVLKIIIGLVMIYYQDALFAGLITAIILVAVNFKIASQIGSYYSKSVLFKDQRLAIIREFITNAKNIKFQKLETTIEQEILKIRQEEYKVLQGTKLLDSICVLLWSITQTVITTITLCVYDPEYTFTVIYLFQLLTIPLNSLPWTVSGILNAKHSLTRIEDFIKQTEVKKDVEMDSLLTEEQQELPSITLAKKVFIIGASGSGKSYYLQSILKEQSEMSVALQTPWLINGTIRDNIILLSEFNEELYRECKKQALVDLSDDLEVGPDGCKLSGGQKQRVCICRALYNYSKRLVLDDVFSSLDPQVADTVYNNIRNRTCIIAMNDDSLSRYVNDADQIILMQNWQPVTDPEQIQSYLQKIKSTQIKTNQLILDDQEPLREAEEIQESHQNGWVYYVEQIGLKYIIWTMISLMCAQVSFNYYDYYISTGKFDSNSLILLTMVDLFVKVNRALSFAVANLKQSKNCFDTLTNNIIHSKARLFDKHTVGQLLSRFADDINVTDSSFPFQMNLFLNNIMNAAGALILITLMQPLMIVPILVIIWVYYGIQKEQNITSTRIRRLDALNSSRVMSEVDEQQKGQFLISQYNKLSEFRKRFNKAIDDQLRSQWTNAILQLWLQVRLQMIAISILILVMVSSSSELLIYYALTRLNLLYNLTLTYTACSSEIVSYERVQVKEPESDFEMPYSDQVEFHNVTLKYDQKLALNNISFKLGTMTAFCGRTGSGKSSILNVLFGMYDYQGKVSVPARTMFEWRNLISVIPQSGYRRKQMDFIDEPMSQGENQRQALALAIRSDSPYIFLDEATASVDYQLEQQMHNDLRQCGKSIILITHRLDNLKDFYIYYLESGEIKEQGTYDDLIKLQGGFYRLQIQMSELISHNRDDKFRVFVNPYLNEISCGYGVAMMTYQTFESQNINSSVDEISIHGGGPTALHLAIILRNRGYRVRFFDTHTTSENTFAPIRGSQSEEIQRERFDLACKMTWDFYHYHLSRKTYFGISKIPLVFDKEYLKANFPPAIRYTGETLAFNDQFTTELRAEALGLGVTFEKGEPTSKFQIIVRSPIQSPKL